MSVQIRAAVLLRNCLMATVVCGMLFAENNLVRGQGNLLKGAAKPQYITRVYNIADLLDEPLMLQEDQDDTDKQQGDGGGGFGGGGMFRIPDNVLPQFGGGGGGFGGGGGGMGGFGGPQPSSDASGVMTRDALEMIAIDHLSDEETQWYSIDGVGGKLSVVTNMMIVTHTQKVHDRLVELLEALRIGKNTSPTVQVDVRIIEVESGVSIAALTSDAKAIETLADDQSAARLSLRCDNHRVAKVSSGLRRSYIVSLVPVVGSNGSMDPGTSRKSSFAYQPVTYSPLLGLFGKIKPEISPDGKSGRIHLGIELASGPEEVVSATFGTGESVDRVEIESARLETSIAALAESWTLAGSVAVTDPTSSLTSGEALPHIAVLVRWKPIQ